MEQINLYLMTPGNISPKANPRHEKFINQMIVHGDKVRAYKAAYPKATDEAARTASTRLLKNAYVRQKLDETNREIHIGIKNDRLAFIYQELKVILHKRKLLLEIITGARKATVAELFKAIRLDNELAEQQAMLLGYGSIKPKAAPQKTAESVTKVNNEQAPEPTLQPTEPAMGDDWAREIYPGSLPRPVTNGTTYSCNSTPGVPGSFPPDIASLLNLLESNRNISPGGLPLGNLL